MAHPNPPPALAHHDHDDSFDLEHNDDKIFRKAVKMHGLLQVPLASLKDDCLRYYVNHAAKWLSIKNRTSINIFDSMPSFLRYQLLTKYLASYVYRSDSFDPTYDHEPIFLTPGLLCPFISLLIGKNINTMDLAPMMNAYYPVFGDLENLEITGAIMDIFSKLSRDSPNLKVLTFQCMNLFDLDQQQLLKHLFHGCRFHNLTALSLAFPNVESRIGNRQLKDISRNFPLLVYLRLHLANNIKLQSLVESLFNLKRLRFFSFVFSDDYYDLEEVRPRRSLEDKVFNFCAPKLPNLEHIRDVKIPGEQTGFCPEKHSLMFSGVCQLRHLCCVNELPEASLPNLSHLCFKGPILNIAVFDARVSLYKNLTAVEFQNVEEERVCLLLKMVGHQLSVLLLTSRMRFPDFEILSLCPNLVKLFNLGQALGSCLGNANKRNVTRMMWSIKYVHLDFKGTRAPQGLLNILLASPKLEECYIHGMIMSSKDCLYFSQLKCPSLTKLHFCGMKPTSDCKRAHLEVMIRGLAVHLPSLIAMSVNLAISYQNYAQLFNWNANVEKYLDIFRALAR